MEEMASVLVVDDDEQIRKLLRTLLEPEGIETIIQLKKINPKIPFIGMSGGGKLAGEYYLKMLKGFLPRFLFKKPIDTEELLQAVQKVLAE